MAHAAAATAQALLARTSANAREETSAVVLSSASSWISKMIKGSQVSITNKYTLHFLVIYIYIYIYIYIHIYIYLHIEKADKYIQIHICFISLIYTCILNSEKC